MMSNNFPGVNIRNIQVAETEFPNRGGERNPKKHTSFNLSLNCHVTFAI